VRVISDDEQRSYRAKFWLPNALWRRHWWFAATAWLPNWTSIWNIPSQLESPHRFNC
jgi:hypothetical protein